MISAGSLVNGKNYNCTITVFDISDNSITSNKQSFICRTTPIWEFSNLTSGQIINNTSYQVFLHYEQAEGELLNEYQTILYSSGKQVIWDSGIKFSSSELSIDLSALTNDSLYYLRAMGKTLNGISLDTDYIPFSTKYESPSLYAIMILENKKSEGIVKISPNIIGIVGRYEPVEEEPVFIEDNYLDLREYGTSVTFDDGFSIDDNFTLMFQGFDFKINEELIQLKSNNEPVSIYWRKGSFFNEFDILEQHVFAELTIDNFPRYVVFSNRLKLPQFTDMLYYWVRRVNGLYEIRIANKGALTVGY